MMFSVSDMFKRLLLTFLTLLLVLMSNKNKYYGEASAETNSVGRVPLLYIPESSQFQFSFMLSHILLGTC